jgi:hypothetical protein
MGASEHNQPTTGAVNRAESLPGERAVRLLLAGVAFAAGTTGLLLVAFPGSTGRFFSWGLEPEPLASLVGGLYLASAVVFVLAARSRWRESRGLVASTLALTIPIVVVTFVHLEVFDLGRWQAWAWVLLFIASPLGFGSILFVRRGHTRGEGEPVAAWARGAAAVLAVGFSAMAVALWWDPTLVDGAAPFVLPPLGGRVLGCWSSLLAFLAAWTVVRGSWDESRLPLLGLAAFFAGALAGAARDLGALQPPSHRLGYLVLLAALLAVTSLVAVRGRPVR